MSRNYDNWERLVAAVLDREKLREIARAPSLSSSFSSITSDACLYALEDVPELGDLINQWKMSATKVQLVRCPNCRQLLAELPDITLYQCGGCGILKAKTRKLDKNNTGLSSQETDSDASRFPSKTSHASVPSNINILSYSAESLPTPRSEAEILSFPHIKAFSFNELKKATGNFRPDSIIGEGGFGCVFKGWIDKHTLSAAKPGSGLVIAVKKWNPEGVQGHGWLTEVNYVGLLRHPNLVRLIGYCSEGDNRLLVFEFMPKGSLENHLFRRGPQPLSWDTRIKVAIDAARGLSFLHEAVIYRDFKASNILLDGEFNAKLSDFGLAKAGPTGDRTHVSTQVMGMRGYAAPEYVATGRSTAKSDVYSFGVFMLELLSGRRAVDKTMVGVEQNLVDWAKPYMNDKRKLFRIMDIKLEGQYRQKAAFTVATVALRCLSEEPKLRPCMAEVLATLQELHSPKTANRHETSKGGE